MPINIIGANGDKLFLITENKLENKFNDLEEEYNYLKDKYLSKCNSSIMDKKCYFHLLKQLSLLFVKKNNVNKLVKYVNKRNSLVNIYQHTKCIISDFDLLHHLHNSLKLIDDKLNYSNGKFISNINYVMDTLSEYDNRDINEYIRQIKIILEKIDDEILKMKNTNTGHDHKLILDKYNKNKISNDFIKNLIISLDDVIDLNKKVNENIINLMNLINELTDKLTNLYTLI